MAWRHRGGDAVAADRDAHHDAIGAAQGGQVLRAVEHQWAARVKSSLSLSLAGSPSMALTTTVPPGAARTGERLA